MINENVSDSAAATQQQHLVLRWALVYIQRIGGGPAGERAQPAVLEKVVGVWGTFAVVSLIPLPPVMAAEMESESNSFTSDAGY